MLYILNRYGVIVETVNYSLRVGHKAIPMFPEKVWKSGPRLSVGAGPHVFCRKNNSVRQPATNLIKDNVTYSNSTRIGFFIERGDVAKNKRLSKTKSITFVKCFLYKSNN